jgi:hypothetical protein
MKKNFFAFLVLSVFALAAVSLDEVPQAAISNGIINARLYLPDSTRGYYRGTRFDWSGVIPDLRYKGHTYFGQWFEKYSPTLHDAIMGPVQEFAPLGYDEAKTGETFIKIGIGVLAKPQEARYLFATPYQILNAGKWAVKKQRAQVEFTHTLKDQEYAYEYKKTVQLVKGRPEMVLKHTLKNTGNKTIETSVYNHNFFVLDSQITGKAFEIKFPYNIRVDSAPQGKFGQVTGNRLTFLKDFDQNDHVYYRAIEGFGKDAKDYNISIENHKTGAAVNITCDRPLSRMVFWSAVKTVCPEPYIQVRVEPGKEFTWNIFYKFYTCEITN